jgi:hypothetical protein
MNILSTTLILGILVGVIHFIIVGILYQNPFVASLYKEAENKMLPGYRIWENKKKYLLSMFLGTQVEIFILTFGYFFLKNYLTNSPFNNAIIISVLFTAIRVYPRFWNMWIQSTYPNKLLIVEVINGIIGTFTIILGLYFLSPILQ